MKTANNRVATYAEMRVQTDILIEIANAVLRIEAKIYESEPTSITKKFVTENRVHYVTNIVSEDSQ